MNWFQKLRRYIIIKTAESYYNRMTLQCIELHKKTRHHHYIIIDPWQGNKVIITNRANFRATKRAVNDAGMRMAVRTGEITLTDVTMPDVHSGCFYSSMLQSDLEKLQRHPEVNAKAIRKVENDIEARRRAYIKWTLDHAKIRKGIFARIADYRKRKQGEKIVRKELNAYKNHQHVNP